MRVEERAGPKNVTMTSGKFWCSIVSGLACFTFKDDGGGDVSVDQLLRPCWAAAGEASGDTQCCSTPTRWQRRCLCHASFWLLTH